MDEEPQSKPRMPRPPSKRTPASVRDLSEEDMQDVTLEALASLLRLDEIACFNLATEYSPEEAAARLGWPLKEVYACLARPAVRRFAQKVQDGLIAEYAKSKFRVQKKVGVTASTVLARTMELAMMDPSETKGRIDGQVKATALLMKHLGMLDGSDDPLKGKSEEEIKELVRNGAKMIEARNVTPQ